jgi:hypothetical protein
MITKSSHDTDRCIGCMGTKKIMLRWMDDCGLNMKKERKREKKKKRKKKEIKLNAC